MRHRHAQIALSFLFFYVFAQLKAATIEEQDSLFQIASSYGSIEREVDSLNEWAWMHYGRSPYVASKLAEKALEISQNKQYWKGEFDANKRLGTVHRRLGNTDKAVGYYQNALELLDLEQRQEIAAVYGNIGNCYLDQEEFGLAASYYNRALKLNLTINATESAIQQYHGLGICHESEQKLDSSILDYRNAEMLAYLINDNELSVRTLGMTWTNFGSPYKSLGKFDSAAYYWKKSLTAFEELEDEYEVSNALNNLGLLQLEAGNAKQAIDSFFEPAYQLAIKEGDPYQIQDVLSNLALAYEKIQMPALALHYQKAYQVLHDSLFNIEKAESFAEQETRFQVKEKELENEMLVVQSERKTLIIVAISIFVLVVIRTGYYLIQRQKKKHRRLQEQSFKREQQDALRILELVRTQELNALEALIEGQEQERMRLSGELHDGLGSLLATVKLYFNQVEQNNQGNSEAFLKADRMLDQACQELRHYAHDLAGLPIIELGLVKTLTDLAASISGAGKMKVNVFAHQMEDRLPLQIERNIYKAVQELLTNVIKHAKASVVTIQMTRHSHNLNLILEDNGIGMTGQTEQSGFGLRSIRARIEGLGGQFIIDSKQGHGTTILIDIPMQEGPDSD